MESIEGQRRHRKVFRRRLRKPQPGPRTWPLSRAVEVRERDRATIAYFWSGAEQPLTKTETKGKNEFEHERRR
jgi:hypothetical protein